MVTYNLNNASLDNTGRYFCSAGCSAKATYSSHTNIDLIYIEGEADQPESAQGVEVGNSATFTCKLTLPPNFPEASGPSTYLLVPDKKESSITLPASQVTQTFGDEKLEVSATFPITLLSQGGIKYSLSILFDNIDGPGFVNTTESLVVVQVVNNTATNLFGVEGLQGICLCSGFSVIKASKAYVIKDEDENVAIGETSDIQFDDTEKKNTASISIPNLSAESMGNYTCVMKFDKGPVISQQNTKVKVLYIEVQPTPYFAGPRGGTATVSCVISYPDSEVFPMTLPTTKWYQTGEDAEGNAVQLPLQRNDAMTLVINPNATKGWANSTGIHRTLVSTLKIDDCEEEHAYSMEFSYKEFPAKTFTSTPTSLIILDVNMTRSSDYAVLGGDKSITCTAYDAVSVKSFKWYKNSVLYSGDSGKQSMSYNADKARSEIQIEWLGVLVEEEGQYHCSAVFQSGFVMSSSRSTTTQFTYFSVLRMIDELPQRVYLTPGYQSSIECTLMLPKDLPVPVIIVKSELADDPVFNQTSKLMKGERIVVNNQDLYKLTFTTPLPSPIEGTKYSVEIQYLEVTNANLVKSTVSSEVKTRKVGMSSVNLNSVGGGAGLLYYYAPEGSWLALKCEAESNKLVNFTNFMFTITKSDTDKTELSVDYETAGNHSMVIRSVERVNFITYVSLNISDIKNDYNDAKVGCTVVFADEDGSNLTTTTEAAAKINILLLETHPKSYGFQRQNGISTDIFAEFQNSESTFYLTWKYYWISSNVTINKPEYEIRVDDKYVESSTSKTELKIVVDDETKNRYYWAVLELNKGILQVTGTNKIITHKSYIIVNDLCSDTKNVKFQVFPPKYNIDLATVSLDVGDLLLIYGTIDLAFSDSQGQTVSTTDFYIGCPKYLPLLKMRADGTNAKMTFQKLSGTCNSESEGIEHSLTIRNIGISLIAMVATETKFLIWSIRGGKRNKIPIPYSTVAGDTDKIQHMMDNEQVKVNFSLISSF